MDPPLILPKGVIKNSDAINHDIEKLNTEPLDLADIAKLWQVYTTTNRRLLDPTAQRLENYWWRIWGSRSRELKASTIAQIFANISDGQSFVPLTSHANRDEGTTPIRRPLQPGGSSTTAIHRPSISKASTTPKGSIAPPPSILKGSDSTKKARGPSGAGPRPTARFISPHESENEAAPVSPDTRAAIQPPSSAAAQDPRTEKEKKPVVANAKKKTVFVASGRGKRPVAVRRQSPQSSTDSPAKGTDVQLQSSSDRTPPQFGEQARVRGHPRMQPPSQDNSSSSSGRNNRKHSASKSSDTRQSASRKTALGNRKSSPREDPGVAEAGPSRRRPVAQDCQIPSEESTAEEVEEIEVQRLLLAEANARVQQRPQDLPRAALPLMTNELAQNLQSSTTKISEAGGGSNGTRSLAQQQNKSAASPAATLATATARPGLMNGPIESTKQDKGKGRDPDECPQDGLFSKRPIQPVSSSSVPDSGGLIRSKSQLTLLLEKDRERENQNSSSIDLKGKRKS